MNTNPDETTLALWLDDELQGEELAAVNAWAQDYPEQLAAREEIRHWRATMASLLPASEEPPAAEFFNGRISHAIRDIRVEDETPATVAKRRIAWRSVVMPLAACAGMALAFWLGIKTNSGPPEIDVAGAPRAIPVEPIVYTPDRGVNAEWFRSSDASATVIVLNGVDAIPDTIDFSATASTQSWREIDFTAGLEPETMEIPSL